MEESELLIHGTTWVSTPHHTPPLEGYFQYAIHFTPPYRVECFHQGEQIGVIPLSDHQVDLVYALMDHALRRNPSPWTEDDSPALSSVAY